MVTGGIIAKSTEASKGGFQSILAVEGVLVPVKRVASKFTENKFKPGTPPDDQAEIALEDAVIVEMEPGEPEPPLQDGRFTTWTKYAPSKQIKPSNNTFFVKAFMTTAEELDAKRRNVKAEDGMLSNLYGTRVQLKKKTVVLFKKPKEGGAEGEKQDVNGTGYVVLEVGGGEAGGGSLDEHIKALFLADGGSALPNAKRILMQDARTKMHPELRTGLDDGTLLERLGLIVVDDRIQAKA